MSTNEVSIDGLRTWFIKGRQTNGTVTTYTRNNWKFITNSTARGAVTVRSFTGGLLRTNVAYSGGEVVSSKSYDPLSALVKLAALVSSLAQAEAAGVGDLSSLKYMVSFIAESVAQTEYLRVIAALPAPSSGQALQLQRIRQAILDGRALLTAGNYLGAIDKYKDAVGRAVRLP